MTLKKCPENPLNRIKKLLLAKIPLFLVCGDSDQVVIYEENGKILAEAYEKSGVEYKLVLTKGRGHHPHGLDDPTLIVEFLINSYEK